MTQEEAKQMVPILQAYTEGKTIQYLNDKEEWIDFICDPSFTSTPKRYRVKPEPREWWICIPTELGYSEPLTDGRYRGPEVSESISKPLWNTEYWTFVKAREVLD